MGGGSKVSKNKKNDKKKKTISGKSMCEDLFMKRQRIHTSRVLGAQKEGQYFFSSSKYHSQLKVTIPQGNGTQSVFRNPDPFFSGSDLHPGPYILFINR